MPSTFGGMGEATVTANEAINILYDEGLIENAEKMGNYFLGKLEDLRISYPELIKDVRGKGLMIGVEFNDISQTFRPPMSTALSSLDNRLRGSITGFVGSIMLNEFRILAGFTEYNRNVLRLHPPLITQCDHIDYFIESIDKILSSGIVGIVKRFIRLKL